MMTKDRIYLRVSFKLPHDMTERQAIEFVGSALARTIHANPSIEIKPESVHVTQIRPFRA